MTIISAHHHQHYRKWPPPTHFRCSNYILDPFKWKTKSRINALIRALKNDFSFQLPNGISSKESAFPEYYTHPLITALSPPLGHHQSNSNTLMAHQVLIYYDSHQTTNVPDGFDQIFRAHTSELFNLETSINRFCRPAMIVLMAHPKMEWRLQPTSTLKPRALMNMSRRQQSPSLVPECVLCYEGWTKYYKRERAVMTWLKLLVSNKGFPIGIQW